ncbi:MAG: hypothetical protein IKO19_06850 [Candidatus Riflebacteria bacterium]|nr:hypothetical protein [Candidatus Riflebacteria bacterium]
MVSEHKKSKQSIYIFVIIAFFTLVLSSDKSFAKEDKSSIVLYNTNVEFSYHQPFRSSYRSNHPSYIEIPRLNHILNLLQNYVQYLKKLNRVKGNPNIKINYAPDASFDDNLPQSRVIKINNLGLANILQKTNQYLVEYGFVTSENIIDSVEGLYSLQESDITRPNNFSKSSYFKNLSLHIPSNEPDTEYELSRKFVLTTRPSQKTNKIYKLSFEKEKDQSGVFSEEAKIWFQNFKISSSEKYLALTDGLVPCLINLETKEFKEIFKNQKGITLLDCEWSPTQNLLAGMILDDNTSERYAFIYDADKGIMLDIDNFSKKFEANYLYATPIWAPKGNKLVFISAKSIHLIDLTNNKVQPNLVSIEGEIGEFIWSEDANSFAFVEVKGQTRSQYHFDDYDFRGCVLHRYRFNNSLIQVAEDYAQQIESRNTIKIISFTDRDQIMYLEGKLVAPEVPGATWDLTKTFNAYLTPLPTNKINNEKDQKTEKTKSQQLPMQYLYVYRSLDSKNANIYDSGMGHSNLLYTEDFYSSWFIGLYRQSGIGYKGRVYSFRSSPYPFQCYNYIYFLDKPQGQARLLLKFLQDYNIRSTDSDSQQNTIFMQTNFSGILNIWYISTEDLFKYLVNGEKKAKAQDDQDEESDDDNDDENSDNEEDSNEDNREEASDTLVDTTE